MEDLLLIDLEAFAPGYSFEELEMVGSSYGIVIPI